MKHPLPWLGVHAALLAVSLVVIFAPEQRTGFMRWAVLTLFLVVAVRDTVLAYRAGDLTKTLSQLSRAPPKTRALEFLAVTCGVIATVLVLTQR